jgi:hypothetical protein
VLLAVATLGVAAGCGGGSARNPVDPSSTPGGGDRIRVEVQNLNFNDVTVWALRNSQRVRVGRVTGKTDQTFTITWNVAQPIWFEIDVVSGRSCRTPQVPVDPESRVWVVIPSEIGLSACRAGRR